MADATAGGSAHHEIDVLVLADPDGGYRVLPASVLDALRVDADQAAELADEVKKAGGDAGALLPERGWKLVGWGHADYEAPAPDDTVMDRLEDWREKIFGVLYRSRK